MRNTPDVNWIREPADELEARVRRIWLDRRLMGDPIKALCVSLKAMAVRAEGRATVADDFEPPSDLRDAATSAEQILARAREQTLRDEIEEIAASIK